MGNLKYPKKYKIFLICFSLFIVSPVLASAVFVPPGGGGPPGGCASSYTLEVGDYVSGYLSNTYRQDGNSLALHLHTWEEGELGWWHLYGKIQVVFTSFLYIYHDVLKIVLLDNWDFSDIRTRVYYSEGGKDTFYINTGTSILDINNNKHILKVTFYWYEEITDFSARGYVVTDLLKFL